MGRPTSLVDSLVISTRIEKEMYHMLYDIAALETLNSTRKVTVQELIRGAISFVYKDNERLRDALRRTRSPLTSRLK